MKPHRSPHQASSAPGAQRGFALLITITLLAFLVLLLVSLASLTRVETQVADNNQRLATARANAIFALNSALGQLQQFVGPDQRVTTTASFGDGTNNALPSPVNGARQWTGVWGNSNTPDTDRSAPVFLNWLVSGNETTTLTARTDGSISSAAASPVRKPTQAIANLTSATALSNNVTIDGQPARVLVGPGTVGTAAGGGLGDAGYVAAPLKDINVPASSIPGKAGTTDTPIGRYAWWVGDEGVKARANLVTTETSVAASAQADKRLRYRAPARAGIELMTNAPAVFSSTDFEKSDSAAVTARGEIRKAVFGSQLQLPANGTYFTKTFLQQHFHDLTSSSQGVLADTLAGGLRKNLTAAFAPGTTKATAPTGPIWQLGTTDALKSADWQLLRSFYQLGTSATGTDNNVSISPQPQIDGTTNSAQSAQQGVFPIVAAFQNYVEGRVNPPGPGSYGLELRYYPAIVLWNPYNVTLKDHTYHLTYTINGGDITYIRISERNSSSPQAYTSVPPAVSPEAQLGTPWVNGLRVAIKSGDMEPGTAYVYTLKNDVYYSSNTFTPYTLERGWNSGGSKSIIASGNSFPLPASTNGYMVSLWSGTNTSGTNTIPSWAAASLTVPTSSGSAAVEPTIRDDNILLATSANESLQYVRSTNNYENAVKMRHVRTTLLFQDIRPILGYIGNRSALKTTAIGTLVDTAYHKNRPIRWLADYNPRAPYSARSPFEMQGDGFGYFQNNPSYNLINDSRRTAGSPFDPVNAGADIACDPGTGRAFVAMSQNTWDGADESTAILFNVPRKEHPLVSLGELQHAQPYRVNGDPFTSSASPAYPIGNSYAPPRGNIDATNKPWSDIAIGSGSGYNAYKSTARVFDDSYLLNRALWDKYFFSSIPFDTASADVVFPLPNPRLDLHGTKVPANLRDYEKAAASLLTNGSFNINSTSAQAWRALLASTNNVPVGSTQRAKESPYPRIGYPQSDSAVLDTAATNAGMKANAYQGYRFLTETQINTLADAIVLQVRRRGPFVSISDFVNRGLDAGFAPATQDNRLKGALTQALENANVNAAFAPGVPAALADIGSGSYTAMNAPAAAGLTATNVPGWVSQADLLQSLAPVISARSDTFIIRAYGESLNPALAATDADYVQSRAWCEAVVQRMPEYINTADDAWKPVTAVSSASQMFGRRFQVVSFRWLSPNDI